VTSEAVVLIRRGKAAGGLEILVDWRFGGVVRVAEIVVVGAGVIGLGVAYELARRGARVTVLDARAAGLGASQASAGVLAPYIEAPAQGALRDLSVESLGLYDEFVARVTRDARTEVEYRHTGTIDVALDADEAEHLKATAGALETLGVRTEWRQGADIFRLAPAIAPAAVAALFIPDHALVSAPGLVRALVRAGESHGVTYRSGARVTKITRHGDRLSVHIEAGPATAAAHGAGTAGESETISAENVVIAAGSWSGQIDTGDTPAVPVRPVRGQLLHLGWRATPFAHVLWGARCYMVPWQDGTVLVGATVEEVGFAEDVTVAGVHTLLSAAAELVPETMSARFKEARVGLRPATTDTVPVIGPSPSMPGLFYATGHYRNGILLAPLTAVMLADGILEGRWHRLLDATSPARFHARDVFRAQA
jgi:glycine oxidase